MKNVQETKGTKIMKMGKRTLFTSMATVALMGGGVATATTLMNTGAVHAETVAGYEITETGSVHLDVQIPITKDGVSGHALVKNAPGTPGKYSVIKAPVIKGYSTQTPVVMIKLSEDGKSWYIGNGTLVYTKDASTGSSSESNTNSGSSSSNESSNSNSESGNTNSGSTSTVTPGESESNSNSSSTNTNESSSSQPGSSSSSAVDTSTNGNSQTGTDSNTNAGTTANTANTSTGAIANALETAKTSAKAQIDANTTLTDAEKAQAKEAIDNATTTAGVNAVVASTKQAKDANGATTTGATAEAGDVQTGVESGATPAVLGGITTFLSGLGLAIRRRF